MMRLGFMPAHPSFYCRRACYTQFGTFDLNYKVAADFEQLLRLIFVHKIRTVYVPADFVTMRTGGSPPQVGAVTWPFSATTAGLCTGTTCFQPSPLLCLRYVYKVGEVLCSRFRRASGK